MLGVSRVLTIASVFVLFAPVSASESVGDFNFLVAKEISKRMSSSQIADCASLTQVSYSFYRKLEKQGQYSVEAVKKVEAQEHKFWVTAYEIEIGQTTRYEELVELSVYNSQIEENTKGNKSSKAFDRAVMSCQAMKKDANMSVHKQLNAEFSHERGDK